MPELRGDGELGNVLETPHKLRFPPARRAGPHNRRVWMIESLDSRLTETLHPGQEEPSTCSTEAGSHTVERDGQSVREVGATVGLTPILAAIQAPGVSAQTTAVGRSQIAGLRASASEFRTP
jgi:hypothetical protein